MKKTLILLLLSLILFSCKDKKIQKKSKTVKKTLTRPDLSIDKEGFHFKFDKKTSKEVSDVFGSYTSDRFNIPQESIELDGISDFVEIFNINEVNPKKEITISIWYKPDSYKGIGLNSIVWKGTKDSKKPYCQYLISTTGNLYHKIPAVFKFGLSINGKYSHLKSKTNIWSPNKWYNITGTYNGTKMKLYVNGDLIAERNVTGKLDIYDTPVLIGKTPYKEFYTSGVYDDFRLINRALNATEITEIYLQK